MSQEEINYAAVLEDLKKRREKLDAAIAAIALILGDPNAAGPPKRNVATHARIQRSCSMHGVGFDVPPGTRAEEKFLRERLDSVLSDQNRIGQILQERTQIAAEQAEALFREAQTKDVTYAIGCGIVHEIRDIQIPAGNPIVSLVFKR
jgi:hypothetical protein